jgi:uncharacterized OB-fold protein
MASPHEPYLRPLPQPTPETLPFWEGCKQHELRIQLCLSCEQYYFYPRPFCPYCFSEDVEWKVVSGDGTLQTYVINHRPAPGFESTGPYVIAIVELAEGPHLMTNIVNVEPSQDHLPVGLPVTVVFDDVTEDITLPKFQPKERA